MIVFRLKFLTSLIRSFALIAAAAIALYGTHLWQPRVSICAAILFLTH